MVKTILSLMIGGFLLGICGCGQSGALYLPPSSNPTQNIAIINSQTSKIAAQHSRSEHEKVSSDKSKADKNLFRP